IQYPFIIGDLKEGVRIFDRQQTNILSSNVASVDGYNAFEQRGMLYRADVRADYKAIDTDAWVNGYIQISTNPST
ncbi:MAG: phage major capsid protein, partial [Oscillospiraceae bacterium]|nr:phage major capsid protein [Oscillospiraceae bacterium]